MSRFKKIDIIVGWAVFIIAALTYFLTLEPTVSLWDCGEFIATGFKLEIGHPPGCAIFMLLTRLFTLFAAGDSGMVAFWANALSATMSALTVLFLFWSITLLTKKLFYKPESSYSFRDICLIVGAGVVGSLAFAFSDSFWFSAVEGEVYATSSFFTAIAFWSILKWEECADKEPFAQRWIILTFFLMGISISVHLLNLLTMPAIFLIWYFKRYEFRWVSFLLTISASFISLALIVWGVIPGSISISAIIDRFFVNSLGMAVNSGTIAYAIVAYGLLFYSVWLTITDRNGKYTFFISLFALFFTGIWIVSNRLFLNISLFVLLSLGLWFVIKKSGYFANLILSSLLVLFIGYSATATIIIRSSANTPLNENNPSNPYTLLYYLNREQYGSYPLFKGQYYNAPIIGYNDTNPIYTYNGEQYLHTHNNFEPIYDKRFVTLFPRMWSSASNHIAYYQSWGGDNGKRVQIEDGAGNRSVETVPSFVDNLRFMFSYQFGYMYMRYFFWNFSGRQNDTQGTGGAFEGNWITGINFLDSIRVGDKENMPERMKNDPSRNVYFMIPFILGLFGLFFQLFNDNRRWWVVMILFILTGFAIVFYLNQYPDQPRERDYAYVGSFYFFTIWIGFGVVALYSWLHKLLSANIATFSSIAIGLIAPLLMVTQNWDDHDRSGRYLTRDIAFNYLESCAPNAILFSSGDNDTFPLWYAQEVEKKRTDIRVCNLMLLNTDWYIDQMKRATNESAPLPITLPQEKYYEGTNNSLYIYPQTDGAIFAPTVIDWIMSDNIQTKVQTNSGEQLDFIPTRTIRIAVDREKVLANGTVAVADSAKIVPYIEINLEGNYITKSQLMIIDILAHNNWERPIYFISGHTEDALGLEEYFQQEGFAYRLVPIKSHDNGWLDYGRIDTDIMYNNLMNKVVWEGVNDCSVYIDYNHQHNLQIMKVRLAYSRLATALALEGKLDKAEEVVDSCLELLPLDHIDYDPYIPNIIEAYFSAEVPQKALYVTEQLATHYYEELDYYFSLNSYLILSARYNIQTALQQVAATADCCSKYGYETEAQKLMDRVEYYYGRYFSIERTM